MHTAGDIDGLLNGTTATRKRHFLHLLTSSSSASERDRLWTAAYWLDVHGIFRLSFDKLAETHNAPATFRLKQRNDHGQGRNRSAARRICASVTRITKRWPADFVKRLQARHIFLPLEPPVNLAERLGKTADAYTLDAFIDAIRNLQPDRPVPRGPKQLVNGHRTVQLSHLRELIDTVDQAEEADKDASEEEESNGHEAEDAPEAEEGHGQESDAHRSEDSEPPRKKARRLSRVHRGRAVPSSPLGPLTPEQTPFELDYSFAESPITPRTRRTHSPSNFPLCPHPSVPDPPPDIPRGKSAQGSSAMSTADVETFSQAEQFLDRCRHALHGGETECDAALRRVQDLQQRLHNLDTEIRQRVSDSDDVAAALDNTIESLTSHIADMEAKRLAHEAHAARLNKHGDYFGTVPPLDMVRFDDAKKNDESLLLKWTNLRVERNKVIEDLRQAEKVYHEKKARKDELSARWDRIAAMARHGSSGADAVNGIG